jgi:hypothetical protein
MITKMWKIKDLYPAEYNPRQIKEVDFAHLQKSLTEFGFVEPVVVNVFEGRRGVIIGGHMRVRAAESIGFKEVPCVELDLPLDQEKELNVRLNANGGTWDWDKIANEFDLADLSAWGFDMDKIPDLDTDLKMSEVKTEEGGDEKEEDNGFEDKAIIFASDNDYDVPLLDSKLQMEEVYAPVMQWGQESRHSTDHKGTMLFYIDDYKFMGVINDPRPIVDSHIKAIAEPNLSTWYDTPAAMALYCIYLKRWFARYCQSRGIRVAVDLNVMPRFRDINLLGVPKGWRSYITRGMNSEEGIALLEEDYAVAREHCGSDDLLFMVVGSGGKAEELCKENAAKGWRFIHQWSEKENG